MLSKFGNSGLGDQTAPSWNGAKALIAYSIPVTIAFSIGTGGYLTAEYCKERKDRVAFARKDIHSEQAMPAATPAHDLDRIKSVLRLTVSELADCIGVSRQAIYNWKSGADIKTANAVKLENLKRAADVISDAGLHVSGLLLGRKLAGGKALLEVVSAGGNGAEAARSLVQMLRQIRSAKGIGGAFWRS